MRVALSQVTKQFAEKSVLSAIDLVLNPGQVVALIGLNGAGKTTLLRCIAGVLTPSAGSIRWNERDALRDDMEVHRQVMFLPDNPLLLEPETVIENIMVMLRAYGRDARVTDAQVIDVLRELDLLEHAVTVVSNLSRGQRYKVKLAALMLIKPELWLLDEPFASGMDPQGIHSLRQHARRAVADGACVVYSTQIIEIAERFCDRLLVIDRSRLVQEFSSDELRSMPADGSGSLAERLVAFREKR